MSVIVRTAKRNELERVNELRNMVNKIHTNVRRKGVATALITFMKEDALRRGYKKIELDMWEFNDGALSFYKKVGFRTYRRYMDMDL